MIQLKDFHLPDVVQSPMANCTDLPFRLIAREQGMRFAYIEMVSAEALVRDNSETLEMMRTTAEDWPVGAQIVGCDAAVMGEAAARVEAMGFALVDMNLGCPVPKVVGKGGGSSLLREPNTAREIFSRVVRSVRRVPVTVKMRLGYSDPTGDEAVAIARIAEECGVDAVAVHGRTREQGYSGCANYEAIGRVKRAVSIPVIGNGDVVDVDSAHRLRAASGCDGVMLGRGALGNPWIYDAISASFEGRPPPTAPTVTERKLVLLHHIDLLAHYAGEERSVGPLRRVTCWYFKDVYGVRQFRDAVNRAQSVGEMRDLIEGFVPDEPTADQSRGDVAARAGA